MFHAHRHGPFGPALACGLLALVGLLGHPLPAAASDAYPPPLTAAAVTLLPGEEERLLTLVNDYRVGLGLSPLQDDPALAAIARAHSSQMAARGQISHEGFERRHRQAGGQVCLENLAAGYRRVDPLLASWQLSPGHDRNLRDPRVSHAGIGQVDGFITLMACRFSRH